MGPVDPGGHVLGTRSTVSGEASELEAVLKVKPVRAIRINVCEHRYKRHPSLTEEALNPLLAVHRNTAMCSLRNEHNTNFTIIKKHHSLALLEG